MDSECIIDLDDERRKRNGEGFRDQWSGVGDQVYAVKVRLATGGRNSLEMAYSGLRGRAFANKEDPFGEESSEQTAQNCFSLRKYPPGAGRAGEGYSLAAGIRERNYFFKNRVVFANQSAIFEIGFEVDTCQDTRRRKKDRGQALAPVF